MPFFEILRYFKPPQFDEFLLVHDAVFTRMRRLKVTQYFEEGHTINECGDRFGIGYFEIRHT